MCTCMGVRSFWESSVTDLGINRAGSWMKLFSCRNPVSRQVKNSLAFTAETVLVLIYKRASLFVQGSCPGWVIGDSMLQAGIVQELRRHWPEPRKWLRPSDGTICVQRARKQSDRSYKEFAHFHLKPDCYLKNLVMCLMSWSGNEIMIHSGMHWAALQLLDGTCS